MRYELTKDLETGNSFIDNEHRQLLKAVNDLMDACSKGEGRSSIQKTAAFLVNYVNTHFAHEEQLQQKNSYPNYAAHKAFHDKYKKELNDLTAKIPIENPTVGDLSALNAQIGVLVSHIRTEDKKLGQFLQNK
ncbi:MAG: hemerythrin family protein [Firmicutes bacterium]|nr:hemerythrin family protein [[Eubacterium] siraeum]MCM1488617.1 hemerythrin family protein [Bacillota bacterium]